MKKEKYIMTFSILYFYKKKLNYIKSNYLA